MTALSVQSRPEESVAPVLRMGLAVSVLLHGVVVLALGMMPRTGGVRWDGGGGGYEEFASVTLDAGVIADEAVPRPLEGPKPERGPELAVEVKEPPEPVPAGPRRVRLGSPTSTSEAATMTWIGFDEYVEHSGMASEVDQAQFTREAPGPRGPVPSEGVAAVPGNPVPASVPAPRAPATPAVGMGETEAGAPDGSSVVAGAPPEALGGSEPRAREAVVVIADEERRPRVEAGAREAARPADAVDGEKNEAVEAGAQAPASLAREVKRQDREEIAAPAVTGVAGEGLVVPRKGVDGAKEEPEFAVAEKRLESPVDERAKVGPEIAPVKARAPVHAEDRRVEADTATDDDATGVGPAAAPGTTAGAAPDKSIPEGEYSQGPKIEEPGEKEPVKADRSENRERAAPAAGGRPAQAGIPAQARAGSGREGLGVLSDRESVAAAIKKAVTLEKWGQPLVARGLKVKTVRPKFSKYTQITASGSPVIRIGFDRKGRARDVIVLQSSGVADVDRPVIDAAYQWTAEGKELEILRENPPETVSIDVRVIR